MLHKILQCSFIANNYSNVSGDVTRLGQDALDARNIYTFKVIGSDKGIPSRTSTVTVRIDSFPADLTLVVINMDITVGDFQQNEADFLNKVRDVETNQTLMVYSLGD